jgi:hypothetical protein
MANALFDHTVKDAMAMPVAPVEVADFDIDRFAAHAAEADQRYAGFLGRREGVAVWQRVRVGEVFRDGCRDMRESLRWQLGGLTRSLDYVTDAPAYLEPWYGIGTTASAFGADYEWLPGQAPAVRPPFPSLAALPARLEPADPSAVPILRTTRETIEYFLEQTRGRVPMSWCDIQSPLNVATGLVSTAEFLLGLADQPDRARAVLEAAADELIRFTRAQSTWIGSALARPGHGFASSRAGRGIGLSTDNLIMISPAMFETYCVAATARIGGHFGGSAMHSCGNWGRWLPVVKKIANLVMIDGAFSPQTDPDCNSCEEFRDALVDTGVILQARIVGDPGEVMARVRRLWKPGLKLMVVTHVRDPQAQHQLYHDIHRYCDSD